VLKVLFGRQDLLDPGLVAAGGVFHQWTDFQAVDPRDLGLDVDRFGSQCTVGAVDIGELRPTRVEDRDDDVDATLVDNGQ
jgi:hypothetical protein